LALFIVARKIRIKIADAHRDNGKRFVVHADEKLMAFVQVDADHSITRQPF